MKLQVVKKSLKARELPAEWRERGQFDPEERVTVWIEREDAELAAAASLQELMDIIGRRADARGLTAEKLAAILNDR